MRALVFAIAVLLIAGCSTAAPAGSGPRSTPSTTSPTIAPTVRATATPAATAPPSASGVGLGVLDLATWDEWCGPLNPFEVTTLDNGWRDYRCKVDEFSLDFATDPSRGDDAIVQSSGSLNVSTGRLSDRASAAWDAWNHAFMNRQSPAISWILDQMTPFVSDFRAGARVEKLFTDHGTINAGLATSEVPSFDTQPIQLITFWLEIPN